MLPIVFYDIPSKLPGKEWSPNPGKTRFVLNYKNLPFETVWVEYHEIARKMKEIGAPINKFPDGQERYTLPVISDPNTGAIVTDSWEIAEYLDKTYSEKPIFPPGSQGLINAFENALYLLLRNPLAFCLLRSSEILNKDSGEYEFFVATRWGPAFERNVEEWSPEGPTREAHWEHIEKNYYGSVKRWYDKTEGKWLMGDAFSYADIVFAARTRWFKRALHDDEWKRVVSLHDGKWGKLLLDAEKECNLA